jgi:hypothetical protein
MQYSGNVRCPGYLVRVQICPSCEHEDRTDIYHNSIQFPQYSFDSCCGINCDTRHLIQVIVVHPPSGRESVFVCVLFWLMLPSPRGQTAIEPSPLQ